MRRLTQWGVPCAQTQGRTASEEVVADIRAALEGYNMVFITGGEWRRSTSAARSTSRFDPNNVG